MDYIPKAPATPPPAKPTYVLVDDSSGLPLVKRGPVTLNFVTYDKDGKRKDIPFKVPFPPNDRCKNCNGRGYVGREAKSNRIIICHKCYPLMFK